MKPSTATDVLTIATKQTLFDRIAAHNGAILCSTKGCPEPATRTVFFTSGLVQKFCNHHTYTRADLFPVYATAEHGTLFGDKSKAMR